MWRKIITFLFDSFYQVVTWVWIGVSISAFFFFASNKSKNGMIGSAVSLLAAILLMLALMAKKHFWDGEADRSLSQQQIDLLKEGKVLFFHFAEGEYSDDDGNTYPIDYCYMFNPKSPKVMRVCPEKFWPKNRTDRRGVPSLDAVAVPAVSKA